MDYMARIDVNPDVPAGKPVVRGTRTSVEFVVELPAKGWRQEQISEAPDLRAKCEDQARDSPEKAD